VAQKFSSSLPRIRPENFRAKTIPESETLSALSNPTIAYKTAA
jgi:hypothetical protein